MSDSPTSISAEKTILAPPRIAKRDALSGGQRMAAAQAIALRGLRLKSCLAWFRRLLADSQRDRSTSVDAGTRRGGMRRALPVIARAILAWVPPMGCRRQIAARPLGILEPSPDAAGNCS